MDINQAKWFLRVFADGKKLNLQPKSLGFIYFSNPAIGSSASTVA